MHKGLFFLLAAFLFHVSFARNIVPRPFPPHLVTIPISYAVSNKPAQLYLPNACSGLVGDYVAGEGTMDVMVQGRIQNGQLLVQVKIDYKGTLLTTFGHLSYTINGNVSAAESRPMQSEPLDIFIKGGLTLSGKNKTSNLYLSELGYITVYPDGSIISHLLDPGNDPAYSRPKIFCQLPNGR